MFLSKNYKLDKNIGHFTCDLVLLLGETPFGRDIASILAPDRTITSRGRLLRRVRMQRLSPVCARPCISLCCICTHRRVDV